MAARTTQSKAKTTTKPKSKSTRTKNTRLTAKKVTTAIRERIIELASYGFYTSDQIAGLIKAETGSTISPMRVRSVRLEGKKQINDSLDEQGVRVRALEPLSLMENRIAELQRVITAEWEKKEAGDKPSHYTIVLAIAEIRKDVNEHESLRQRWWAMLQQHPTEEKTEIEERSAHDEARERYSALIEVLDDVESLGEELLNPTESKKNSTEDGNG